MSEASEPEAGEWRVTQTGVKYRVRAEKAETAVREREEAAWDAGYDAGWDDAELASEGRLGNQRRPNPYRKADR